MTTSQGFIYTTSIALTLGIQLSGFAVAFALQTEIFYDILGGINYLALAVWSALAGDNDDWFNNTRKVIMTLLFLLSRGWLLMFLAWRAHERGGDARFDTIKTKFVPFLTAWVVQGMWCFLISMPIIFVNSSSKDGMEWTLLDWTSVVGFALGLALEIAGDVQKSIWVKAGRPGGFCTKGVWKYSRHPNYFGEMLQWWCAWFFAYSSSQGLSDKLWWLCSLSPLFTMHILLNVPATGIAHAEGQNSKRYYEKHGDEYAKYRRNTSILVPMVGYRHVPMCLKRTLFLDLERYEYKPDKAE